MALSQKTGYSMLLISALLSLLQAINNIIGQPALFFGNTAVVFFGLGALIIILKARHNKFLFYSCIAAFLIAVLLYIPYGPRLSIAFACLAPFSFNEKNVPQILSASLMLFGVIGVASIAFALFNSVISAIIYLCAAAASALYSWLNIRYEDGMER